MKRFFYVIFGLFFVSLAIVVGIRMSADAMAVIIGIICGMVASIPTTLLLIYTLRQRDRQQEQVKHQMSSYPPVVVVNAPPNGLNYGSGMNNPNPQSLLPAGGERSFKVVGQDATPLETLGEAFNIDSIWDERS